VSLTARQRCRRSAQGNPGTAPIALICSGSRLNGIEQLTAQSGGSARGY